MAARRRKDAAKTRGAAARPPPQPPRPPRPAPPRPPQRLTPGSAGSCATPPPPGRPGHPRDRRRTPWGVGDRDDGKGLRRMQRGFVERGAWGVAPTQRDACRGASAAAPPPPAARAPFASGHDRSPPHRCASSGVTSSLSFTRNWRNDSGPRDLAVWGVWGGLADLAPRHKSAQQWARARAPGAQRPPRKQPRKQPRPRRAARWRPAGSLARRRRRLAVGLPVRPGPPAAAPVVIVIAVAVPVAVVVAPAVRRRAAVAAGARRGRGREGV
jgi:hypothetical protein